MKKYLLFGITNWYPQGGWDDFEVDFDSLDEAINAGKKLNCDTWHIVSTGLGKVVDSGRTDKREQEDKEYEKAMEEIKITKAKRKEEKRIQNELSRSKGD